MANIIIFGPPGSGKGTQSKLIEDKIGIIQVSTGDICREEIKKKTKEGLEAKRLIDGGNFFPDELAFSIMSKFINQNPSEKGYIFDGIPRHLGQVEPFDKFLESINQNLDLVIELSCEDNFLIERLLNRGKLSGRADDSSKDIITKRLKIYNEVTAPIAEEYQKRGIYHKIDTNAEIEDINNQILELISDLTCKKAV
ncbi:MAG: adenylate kinase [Marinifilaceae bacterium]|jgi:adenylate kinase|nr:adenylate kinase [Marinifilaceae bacterium]